jgi:hypothetical protein
VLGAQSFKQELCPSNHSVINLKLKVNFHSKGHGILAVLFSLQEQKELLQAWTAACLQGRMEFPSGKGKMPCICANSTKPHGRMWDCGDFGWKEYLGLGSSSPSYYYSYYLVLSLTARAAEKGDMLEACKRKDADRTCFPSLASCISLTSKPIC